jgi:polysaccharide export outer membrane protein
MSKNVFHGMVTMLMVIGATGSCCHAMAVDEIEAVASPAATVEPALAIADTLAEVPPVRALPDEPAAVTSTPLPAVIESGYRVGPEDVLEIAVWKEEGLKKEVLVRPDGGISFPLVGEIRAAGKTADEIRAEISARLKKSINDPVVSVSVLKVAGNKIYVIGRVARPGEYAAGRYVDVLQALAIAGGLTPYAAEDDIKILRKHSGGDETFEFQYSDVRKGKRLEQNILLQGGDVVVVP